MGHGAMLTLGAYFTWAATTAGVPFVAAVLAAAIGVAVIGLALEHFAIRYFYDRPFDTLLLTWGFFLIATELIKIIFGTDLRGVADPLPGSIRLGAVTLPAYRSVVALISLLLLLALAALLFKTSLGIKIRALTQNAEAASLLGLDIGHTYKLVFVCGAFLAGLAGALISPMLSIDPYIGNIFLVRAFFVVIVGGIGQVLSGTLIGSFVIGGSETVFALFSGQVISQTIVFVLAIVLLRFRPAGVIGRR
jgi:branched-subunit amino acid ABC-type transport system permease component